MSNLWLTVDVQPGASISSACNEAIALAGRIGITIWFNFNGVKCLACKGDDPRRLEADWNRAMSSKASYKIASDKGEVPNKM